MNVISIFIAGAKSLKEQRLGLKALTNDLNSKYDRMKWQVSLHTNSYENFGDRQDDYDDFITNQADLVIFVLEERIGRKTEEEYLLATDACKKNGHPEIITFVHAFDERTPEIDHMEQLLNSATDTYYVDYTNTEDLLSKAKDRINGFVEKRISQKKTVRSRKLWRRGLLYAAAGVLLLTLLFVASVLFSPERYLVVMTPDPPVSLVKAGMGGEFVKQQIVDGVKETGDSAQAKFSTILGELQEDAAEGDSLATTVALNAEWRDVVKSDVGYSWLWRLRRLLGKHDLQVGMRLVESEHSFISRITLDTWDGRHEVKTIEAMKGDFTSDQRCALSVLKRSAAYVISAYSPVASALYDYRPAEGLEVYQMSNPWREDVYTHSQREALLLEGSDQEGDEAAYGLLLLANFYEKAGLEQSSGAMMGKACDYYKQYLERSQAYEPAVSMKLANLESALGQDDQSESTIPDVLIGSGVIPSDSLCQQLIVVTDEESLYANSTTYYKAVLHGFEVRDGRWVEAFPAYRVNLGVKGMAPVNQKTEGDLKTPSGYYPIPFVFGYRQDVTTKMQFVEVGKNHVWVCDPSSDDYNKMVVDVDGRYKNNLKNEKLFRPDVLNKYAVVIGYNMNPVERGRGSAVFMHVERSANHKTAGCISMSEESIKSLIMWLDPQKNPHVYISKSIPQ